MRKKNILLFADTFMWTLIYILPLLIFAISVAHNPNLSLNTFLTSDSFGVLSSGIVFDTLNQLFGTDGILPLFATNSGTIFYMSYLVNAVIIHLAVDFLLFIPRFAHKAFDKLGGAFND